MGALNDWTTVDANNNQPPPDGWPENTMQYSDVNNTGRAVQGTMRRFWGDVNGSLLAAGVADAYTLTLNETGYTSYFAGMYFACEIPATNTGATTIDVNGIGVQSVVNRDGTPLTGGELDSGGIYEFRYDGTNFQLMGTIGSAIGTAQATLTNSNAPDLVDTDVALRVGASDPDTAAHVEVGPAQIQAKADATNAAEIDINSLGGIVNLGAQSGTGTVRMYANGVLRALAASSPIFLIRGDANADPTVPDNIDIEYQFRSQDDNEYGGIGYNGSTTLRLFNRAHGGVVQINAENAAGSAVQMFQLDPDGDAIINPPTGGDVLLQEGGVTRVQLDNTNGRFVVNDYTTFLEERAAALADVAGYGQLWVRDDTPNVLMFTDDAGTDFVIGGTGAGFDPSANQTITGDWTFQGQTNFENPSDDLQLDPNVSINMRNSGDTSSTFLQNLGPTFQFGIAGADFGSGIFELGNSWSHLKMNRSIVFDEQASAPVGSVAGDGQIWVRNDSPNVLMYTDDAGTDFVISAGGGAGISGTPANNQLAVWVDASNIEGESELTFDGTQLQLLAATARQIRVATTGTGLTDDASLLLESEDANDGIEIVQTNDVIADARMWRTNGTGTQGNQLWEVNTTDTQAWYSGGVRVMNTVPDFSGGLQVRGETNQTTGLARVLIDQDDQFLEGRQPLGGFSADQIGISTVTITNTNIQDYNGHDINLTSGDTLRFGSISGGGTNEAGGILTISNGTVTIGASNISVDFWEIQPSGITYHNLSGTSTFTASSPGIGAWRYIGTSQVVGFICAP